MDATMLDHSCQVQRHPHSERGDDLYETPDVAVSALLMCEKLPPRVWEPACGRGAIVRVLESAGHEVVASDIRDYGVRGQVVQDFFEFTDPETRCIITNPPFMHADRFVRHALKLMEPARGKVVMLLRLAFYESVRRMDILEFNPLVRIHVFRKRLPMMHRDGWEGKKGNSGMAFAWFVWDFLPFSSTKDTTTIDRISW
jgi:hypothetical protein